MDLKLQELLSFKYECMSFDCTRKQENIIHVEEYHSTHTKYSVPIPSTRSTHATTHSTRHTKYSQYSYQVLITHCTHTKYS